MRNVVLRFVLLALITVSSASKAQSAPGALVSSTFDLVISGPHVVRIGENLWFTATLTNRSGQAIAVPSKQTGKNWQYMGGEWWKIADKWGRQLQYKPGTVAFTDNNTVMPTYDDTDFVLLKPGEKIEYKHETLGDPSDKFIFPGKGIYSMSLSWNFCPPKVRTFPNGNTGHTCGITRALSPSVREVLLATPAYEVKSNVWNILLH